MSMMSLVGAFFFALSCITLLLAVLGRMADRPVLGLTPRDLLDITRTCLLFSIAAAVI